MVLRKHELEGKLGEESLLIQSGVLRDENPLDTSLEFQEFLLACRRGDLKKCQELIGQGVNINGKDKFDYTPLIIASLCGHYELVQLLLESGALAERNTFQGERCIYNALNDRIRNLLLKYDFSKSSDPYVYWSSHISALLSRASGPPRTSDISLEAASRSFSLHKFLLASRTPYFGRKLEAQPETSTWKLSPAIPVEAFQIAVRYIYLGDVPRDLVPPGSSRASEDDVAKGLDKITKQLGIEHLWEAIMAGGDRRLARQRYQDEVERALKQVRDFFQRNVLGHKMVVDTDRAGEVRWKRDNSVFADVLLRADEPLEEEEEEEEEDDDDAVPTANGGHGEGVPIGSAQQATTTTTTTTNGGRKKPRKSILYPVHKAMLIRSEYFDKMFSGDFVESQEAEHLHIVTVDCSPPVLEVILNFLYTENGACPLEHALDLLYAADMLFLDSLKSKAAIAISTLGSGTANVLVDRTHDATDHNINNNSNNNSTNDDNNRGADGEDLEMEPINIYDVIHAAWDLRVQRLEEFAARYLANRLEDYIDEPDFHELIRESAARIRKREETDTIELLDDIRYYLSERFRLRFEDAGLDEMMDENGEISAKAAAALAASSATNDTAAASTTTSGHDHGHGHNSEHSAGVVQTLDGETAEDEFASDAINYQILLNKIDAMLELLKLDA